MNAVARVFKLNPLFLALLLYSIPSISQAVVRCIDNESEFESVMDAALASANAVEDVRIKTNLISFNSGSIGYFGVLEGTGKTLTISGGWSGAPDTCSTQSGNPVDTILSGNNARPVFGINASTTFTGSVHIQNITFNGGLSDGVSTPSCLSLGEQNGGVMGVQLDRVWVEACNSTVPSGPNPHAVSLISSSELLIRNSLFGFNNSGAAVPVSILIKAGTGYFVNNTVARNTSSNTNGFAGLAASASDGAELIIANNLMDLNVATETTRYDIRIGGLGTVRLQNNRFSGLSGVPTEQTGSSTGSAGFDGGGYELDSSSTAINAGTFLAAPIQGGLDIISNARVTGAAVDLGAFEFQPPPQTGPAYSSNPTQAQDINFGSVIQNDTDPFLDLQITNTGAAESTLTGNCFLTAGGGTFSISGDNAFSLGQGESDTVRVVCDSAQAVQQHIGELQCTHNGEEPGEESPAVYQLDCEILAPPESDVIPSPASGTSFEAVLDPGGTFGFDVLFPEVKDEGVDASLVDCSLDDGSVFAITSPASFPQVIGSGSSVTVSVEGTAPGGASTITDTLRCTYTDTDSDLAEVVYPISVVIEGNAYFSVTKDFSDNNPGEVTVRLDCNTGLILDQDKVITEADGNPAVIFVVTDFDSGELNCTITEDPVAGYEPAFNVSGDSAASQDAESCSYTSVAAGDENSCVITNTPLPVEVVINKQWVFEGSASAIDTRYELTLYCSSEILAGNEKGTEGSAGSAPSCGFYAKAESPATFNSQWCKTFYGDDSDSFTAEIIPGYPSSDCHVEERIYDDAVEVANGCGNITISAGNGAECTITNTVFFEGIPTLSSRSLALLALLMLGLGLVGLRRFV